MIKGRIPCVKLPKGSLVDALLPHVLLPVSLCCPYSKIHFRKRPNWTELFRVRSIGSDMFTTTHGFCVSQKYLESELDLIFEKLYEAAKDEKKAFEPETDKEREDLGYRIRAVMAHSRATRTHGWKIPVRFGVLKALVAQAKLEFPEKSQLAPESPIKDTKRRNREMVWMERPGKFGSPSTGTPVPDDSDADVDETSDGEGDCVFVGTVSPAKSESIDISDCESTDNILLLLLKKETHLNHKTKLQVCSCASHKLRRKANANITPAYKSIKSQVY